MMENSAVSVMLSLNIVSRYPTDVQETTEQVNEVESVKSLDLQGFKQLNIVC